MTIGWLKAHDATTPSNILGGKIKIGSAVAGSNITLRTDYDNNMSTEEVQKNVLNALANKLYYSAYTTNEVNLSGKVEIAEGLTTQAASKYVGDIVFDKSNGQGSLNNGITPTPGQTVTDFTSSITGGTDKPYVDGGVKQTDGSYLFTKDSKITLTSGNVIQPGYNSTININAAGKVLTADVNGSKLLTGIYNTSSNGNVNITADKTIFNINNDNKEYIQKAYGIWMNSDGGKVTISGLTEINTNAADLSYGINASSGSIQLDGLHDANTPTTIIGGDVKIGTAATGSNITLRTDNTGLNTSSTLAVDKNLVSATLNALANKLYYTAYTTNERNLTGKVEIAEGLTAQSASMAGRERPLP